MTMKTLRGQRAEFVLDPLMEPVKDLEDGGDMIVFTPPRQDPGSAFTF